MSGGAAGVPEGESAEQTPAHLRSACWTLLLLSSLLLLLIMLSSDLPPTLSRRKVFIKK